MDRLETKKMKCEVCYQNDLHSSMDRLETKNKDNQSQIKKIYIPVWIDQKHDNKSYKDLLEEHLHSSMDRLETLIPF